MWIIDQFLGRGIPVALIGVIAERDSGTRTEPSTQPNTEPTRRPLTASSGEEH